MLCLNGVHHTPSTVRCSCQTKPYRVTNYKFVFVNVTWKDSGDSNGVEVMAVAVALVVVRRTGKVGLALGAGLPVYWAGAVAGLA